MNPSPSRRSRACLRGLTGGLTGLALLAAVLPLGTASAATLPSPTPAPAATPVRQPVLPAPGITGPNDAVTVRKDVVLDWDAVPGATAYDVQVGQDENWSDAPTLALTTSSTQVTLPQYLPHAHYVWRVAAKREGGTGRWSATASFTRGWRDRPQALSPAPGSASDVLPEFTWSPVRGASAYEVQVSNTPAFDEKQALPTPRPTTDGDPTQDQVLPKVDTCFTTHTSVTPFEGVATVKEDNPGACASTVLLGSGGEARYWRVRALDRYSDDSVPEADTDPASREGISHLPPFPQSDDEVVRACPGAPSNEVSPSPSASASPSPTAAPQPVGCDRTHPAESSAWSETVQFSVRVPPVVQGDFRQLPLVQLRDLREENPCVVDRGQQVCTDMPTIRWDRVAGAVAYRVYLSLTPTYSNIVRIVDTPGLSYRPTDSWRESTAGKAYYYVVQPCTLEGCGAVTADPPSFRKTSPALAPAAPAAGAALGAGDVVFSWQDLHDALGGRNTALQVAHNLPTAGASAYRLQVTDAADPDFREEPLLDEVVDGTTFAPLEALGDAGALFDDGSYRWRVQALDGSFRGLPWSAPRTFSYDGTRATVTATPAGLSVAGTVKAVFSEPVRGVTARSLYLSPVQADGTVDRRVSTAARVVVLSDREATLTPTSPLVAGRTYQLVVDRSVRDQAGNSAMPEGPSAVVAARMDDGSKGLAYGGTWGWRSASGAVGGGYRASKPTRTAQTAVTGSVFGRGVSVVGCVGPYGGLADLWVDGVKRMRVDTYRTFSGCGVTLASWRGEVGVHRAQLRGVGLKRAASTGTWVMVDAVDAK